MSEVNSRDYWEGRFRENWDARGGGPQSQFFGEVALALLPDWLKAHLRTGGKGGAQLSVCDVGCAEGTGTHVLAEGLKIDATGVDFSAEAIEMARARHPGQAFLVADLLAEPGSDAALTQRFDVVFSSNTLEHFRDPWAAFDAMAAHADRFVVLLLPWREGEQRDPEHFVQFVPAGMPIAHDGWVLAHATAANVKAWPGSKWSGEQVLCVYARPEALAEVGLHLDQVRIEDPEHERVRDEAASAIAQAKGADAAAQAALTRATASDEAARIAGERERIALAKADAATARADAALASEQAATARATAANTAANAATARATKAEAAASSATSRAQTAENRARVLAQDLATEVAKAKALDEARMIALATIAKREAQLAALDQAHNALLARQPALEHDRADLQRIRASRLWRWSAPLRRMLRFVRPHPQA